MKRYMSYWRNTKMRINEKVSEEELKELEDFWEQLQKELGED